MVKFGDEFVEKQVPEWSSKYIRYNHLGAILSQLPKRDKATRKSDEKIVQELESVPKKLQQNAGSPDASEVPVVPSRRRLSVSQSLAPSSSGGTGSIRIELRSEVSSQNEYRDEEYQYFVFVPEIELRIAAVTKEIARLSAACQVHSHEDAKACLAAASSNELADAAQLRLLCFYFAENDCLTTQKNFFDDMNADIKKFCEFRANNIFHCIEQHEEYNKVMHALVQRSESAREDSAHLTLGLDKLRALKEASELKVEAQQLAVAYDQLMKLVKIIDSFTELNLKALFKIVKKHDKVSLSFRNTKTTLEAFAKSEIVVDMGNVCVCQMFMKTFGISSQGFMQRGLGVKIEEDYVKLHEEVFSYERGKALDKLRLRGDIVDPPMPQSDTFTLGCLIGCMLPLLLYCFMVVVSGHHVTSSPRWQFVWVHFRMTFLCILHATMWAWNIYVFKAFKINYCLIFDISPGSQLHFNTLLKLCAAAFLWSLLWLTVSLQQIVNENSGFSQQLSQYSWEYALEQVSMPGRLVVLSFVVLLFLPLPFVVYGTRRYLLSQLFKMSLVPLLEVTWPMFFLGDQLCSHARLLNDFMVFSCVSLTNPSYSNVSQYFAPPQGSDVVDDRTCFNLGTKTIIRICSGCLPLVIRWIQQMRRYYDTKNDPHAKVNRHHWNALKYFVSMTVVISSNAITSDLKVWAWSFFAVAATLFSSYWDFKFDFGLGDKNYGYLRKNLSIRPRIIGTNVYYVVVVLNVLLRCSWVLSITSPSAVGITLDTELFKFVLAALEIIRRCIWNVFRVEWEQHANNSEWRAVKKVDLDFTKYYTQTRAIGAFASVGAEKMADACSQGVLGCLKSCVCWGKRTVDVKQIRQRKMEMQKMTQANDGEDDHLNLI